MDEITKQQIHGVLENTAKRYDTTVEAVIREIEDKIMDGYLNVLLNYDVPAYKKWKAIPSERGIPNVYEFLHYLLGELRREKAE